MAKAGIRKINPNASKAAVFKADLSEAKCYPRFIRAVSFDTFRHIPSLTIDFKTPISVIAGNNKSGKTTTLLAIACSHFEFKKRNYKNGKLERQTWSKVLKFTGHDIQDKDWTYHLNIKTGDKTESRRGQRKKATKKWNGVGKKESQIKGVEAVYLDLDRILPARYYSDVLHRKAQTSTPVAVSTSKQKLIEEFVSYVLEQEYKLSKLADYLGKDLLGFANKNIYSSYNSASGEDVIARVIIDCVEAPSNSLVLIDEIELGLHPHTQRRLMDVIFEIADRDMKQFIVTTHSGTILSCVPDEARIFIDSNGTTHNSISPISINAALTKMDSAIYPLVDLFVEDDVAEKILKKALKKLNELAVPGISSSLFNLIKSGSASDAYDNFVVRERIYHFVKICSGHACVLDGDMQLSMTSSGSKQFPKVPHLFFLPGTEAPEKMLCRAYESNNVSATLNYHVNHSNVHCLFLKMVELGLCLDTSEAFETCWPHYIANPATLSQFQDLVAWLVETCQSYSPDL